MRFFLLATILLITITSCEQRKEEPPKDEEPIISIDIPYRKVTDTEKKQWHDLVEGFYNSFMKPKLNGQFLVAKNGEILYEAYNGRVLANKDSSTFMNEHSAIHLASVSKTFTAGSILLLSQQGKLNLDDLVKKHLPTFPYKDVTIKMLLNHRAGLPDYTHLLWDWGWPSGAKATNKDILDFMVRGNAFQVFKTNTKFDYCNTNYVMLALIIEAVSGMSYPAFAKRYIFKPLQMNDTYVFEPKDTLTAIPSYDYRKRIYEYNELDLTYGDKNVYSTVRDLLKWDQVWYTNKLFDEKHKAMAYQGYSYEKKGTKKYGLGWRMFEFDSTKKIIFHNGWWHGNNNSFIRLFQDSATFICLGNVNAKSNYAPMELCSLFGDYPFGIEKDEAHEKDTTGKAEALLLAAFKAKADSIKKAQKQLHTIAPKPIEQPKEKETKKKDTSKMIINDKKKVVKDTGAKKEN